MMLWKWFHYLLCPFFSRFLKLGFFFFISLVESWLSLTFSKRSVALIKCNERWPLEVVLSSLFLYLLYYERWCFGGRFHRQFLLFIFFIYWDGFLDLLDWELIIFNFFKISFALIKCWEMLFWRCYEKCINYINVSLMCKF